MCSNVEKRWYRPLAGSFRPQGSPLSYRVNALVPVDSHCPKVYLKGSNCCVNKINNRVTFRR